MAEGRAGACSEEVHMCSTREHTGYDSLRTASVLILVVAVEANKSLLCLRVPEQLYVLEFESAWSSACRDMRLLLRGRHCPSSVEEPGLAL